MFFSRIAPVAALVGAAAATFSKEAPATCDLAKSWEDETLFKGVVGFDAEAELDIELDLNIRSAQIEGEVSLECLDNFEEDQTIRLDLAGIKAWVEIDLSASAGVFQTIELLASSELEIDLEVLEIELGAAFALDLVVSVDACIDLSAGFYVSFSEGDYIDISIIDKEVVGSKLEGLEAKALDIGVGAEVDLSAAITVQLGLRLRSHISIEAGVELFDLDIIEAGAEVALWVDLLTYTFVLIETDDCIVSIDSEFFLALGLAVNVDVEVLDILDISLAPEVTVKLAAAVQLQICLPDRGTVKPPVVPTLPSATSTGAVPTVTAPGQVTSTLTTTKMYTVTSCHVSVPNCPASQTQVIVTSVVESTVTVCPANQTAVYPTTSATSVKPVPTITEVLTTVVPCKPTTSTFVAPPGATAVPVPTVTISQAPGQSAAPTHPAVTGAPSAPACGNGGPACPAVPTVPAVTGAPSAPACGNGGPACPVVPTIVPSYPAPNNTFTSIAPPAAQPSTWVPPTTAPSEVPQAGAASFKAGFALALPVLVAMML